MSQFCLLGAGFIDPEISPTDRQVCRDRPTGEISGLARLRLGPRWGVNNSFVLGAHQHHRRPTPR